MIENSLIAVIAGYTLTVIAPRFLRHWARRLSLENGGEKWYNECMKKQLSFSDVEYADKRKKTQKERFLE
ncbi:MAG: hypothetical protein FWE69_02150, partial [Clostridiales bacterium]|nr:hypothetical protein [Clostridiales bacterium]